MTTWSRTQWTARARNLDDLRALVRTLTGRGVRVQFVTEQLTFTGEDTHIGLEPVVQASNRGSGRARLSWVDQNYIRGETITAATARRSLAATRAGPGGVVAWPPPDPCA